MSTVVIRDGKSLLITKGAPESVIQQCSAYRICGSRDRLYCQAKRPYALRYSTNLSNEGYRVLAVAYRDIENRDAYSADDESALVLAGYLAFADPPRTDTGRPWPIWQDGVQLKIVTGDNELVTRHVCEQVGIDTSDIVLGDEIERMTDAALQHVVEETTVFARVSPAQKSRIILALKHRSHVVGYLGDGINDAPSLHAADVGISVDGAADVARDAADIILVEPGLQVLHAGILEGRRASGNVLKYLLMGTSSNFGNMLSMAGASLFLPFYPCSQHRFCSTISCMIWRRSPFRPIPSIQATSASRSAGIFLSSAIS